MRYYDVEQGTKEWLGLRLGVITASNFCKIAQPKGRKKDGSQAGTPGSQDAMLDKLVAERITGEPADKNDLADVVSHIQRGKEMEGPASDWYELSTGLVPEECGFFTNDAGDIGASPDRKVGDDGLTEVKNPMAHTHVGYLRDPRSFFNEKWLQVCGQIWVCDREWCDLVSYSEVMPVLTLRVRKDGACVNTKTGEVVFDDMGERMKRMIDTVTEFASRVAETAKAITPEDKYEGMEPHEIAFG